MGETDRQQKGENYLVVVSAMQRIKIEWCSNGWGVGGGAASVCVERGGLSEEVIVKQRVKLTSGGKAAPGRRHS